MKDYGKIYLKVYIIVHLIFLILAVMVYRRVQVTYPFARLEMGALIVSAIVGFAVWLFRLEKGNSVLNTILGYVVIIPSIFVLRNVFGQYLFRFSWFIYVLMVIVGIIYGVAVLMVSKKYKKEVDDLNELLKKDKNVD
jgi:glucose dehydrogenase